MKSPLLRRLQILLSVTSCLIICLFISGCVKVGGTDTVNRHIFQGEEPVNGTVQIATNKRIPVVSKSRDGKTNYEERDCGQFVLVPPWIWRATAAALDEYKKLYGPLPRKPSERTENQPPGS